MIVACLANYWIFIPSTIIMVVLVLFRHYFLCTSRNVQRLEAIGKLMQNDINYILLFHQLVVHCIHTSLLQFKAYQALEHFMKKTRFLINFTFIKMNTPKHGI